mgnify:FL=1
MANVKIARVDFRLIHGQVITKWIKYYPVDKIIIIDDVLAADEFMKEIYGMAVPKGIEFDVLKIDEATEKLQKTDKSVFLLFKNRKPCIYSVNAGVAFEFLVIGGVPGNEKRTFISDGINLLKEEFLQLESIQTQVPEIIFKGIPEEHTITMEKAKEKFK